MRPTIRTSLTVLCAMAVWIAVAASAAPAALAAGTYAGGADVYPQYVPNDHTPVLIHLSVTGLTDAITHAPLADTAVYVKVRFSLGPTPSGASNRGWTWNPVSKNWVQERDNTPAEGSTTPWSKFPQVTTDAAGNASARLWTKFGDTRLSGPYYILVSLSQTGDSDTLNGDLTAPVTVMDMTATGAWIHNGAGTGAAATQVAAAPTPRPSPAATFAMGATQPAGFGDPDGSLVHDDYGYAGLAPGDFRLAVPLSQPFDVLLDGTPWTPGLGLTLTQPDVDVAVGAADQTPPSLVTGLTATPGDGSVVLSWQPATDNIDGAGTLSYAVFRWADPTPIPVGTSVINYTSAPRWIATTTSTAYSDDGLTNGTPVHYLVRAVDTATNVGPRSNTVDAVPAIPTKLTLKTTTPTVPFGSRATLTAELKAEATALAGKDVTLEWSPDGTSGWQTLQTLSPEPAPAPGNTYRVSVTPYLGLRTSYRLSLPAAAPYAAGQSQTVTVTPKVYLAAPSAPRAVASGHAFTAYGDLKPHKRSGAHSVRILCYRRTSGRWVLKKTVTATDKNRFTFTRYQARITLPSVGRWRLRASFAADGANAATLSRYREVAVR